MRNKEDNIMFYFAISLLVVLIIVNHYTLSTSSLTSVTAVTAEATNTPATIGTIQAVSETSSGNITVRLSQLSSYDNSSNLSRIIYNWGDCQTSVVYSNIGISHHYSATGYGSEGSAWMVNSCASSATIYAYPITVEAIYSDGKTLNQTFVLTLPMVNYTQVSYNNSVKWI